MKILLIGAEVLYADGRTDMTKLIVLLRNFAKSLKTIIRLTIWTISTVPVAAQSKEYVCGSSPAEIVGLNPTEGGMNDCLLRVLCVVR